MKTKGLRIPAKLIHQRRIIVQSHTRTLDYVGEIYSDVLTKGGKDRKKEKILPLKEKIKKTGDY